MVEEKFLLPKNINQINSQANREVDTFGEGMSEACGVMHVCWTSGRSNKRRLLKAGASVGRY